MWRSEWIQCDEDRTEELCWNILLVIHDAGEACLGGYVVGRVFTTVLIVVVPGS